MTKALQMTALFLVVTTYMALAATSWLWVILTLATGSYVLFFVLAILTAASALVTFKA
jgi:uncharacterized membrane protein YesL